LTLIGFVTAKILPSCYMQPLLWVCLEYVPINLVQELSLST